MVRKVSRQGSLIKELAKNHEKKQLNHLMKVLRPRVYITDCSNFKRLVQQLTGNRSSSPPSSSLPISQSPQFVFESVPVVHIKHHGGDHAESPSNSSAEAACSSLDESIDSLDRLCNNNSFLQGLLLEEEKRLHLNETRTFDASSMNQDWDCLAFQKMESWLLDVDHQFQPLPNLNGFVQNHQEVSVYDYELSWASVN